MTVRVGYIPYLNMAPFHYGFGPEPLEVEGHRFEFAPMSPRTLGLEAEREKIDSGAMSLVDGLRLASTYEVLGKYGIGVKREAQSVLLFSKKPLKDFEGFCAVTDETSTSFRLLQILLEARHHRPGVHFGRIASSMLFDGEADGLLLIGNEALKAKEEEIKGLPVVTDLGEEWFAWHNLPFVFARWMVRKKLGKSAKVTIEQYIEKSLKSNRIGTKEEMHYWDGFAYELTPDHERSIALFAELLDQVCLSA